MAPVNAPEHHATSTRPRTVRWVIAATVVAALAAGTAGIIAATRGGDDAPEPAATATAAAADSPAPTPTPASTASAAPGALDVGEVILTAGEGGIALYDAPGDGEPAESLGRWSLYGSPLTLMGFAEATVDDERWVEVELVGAPNHRRAWVREADASVSSTDVAIHVFLEERELEVMQGDESAMRTTVVVGAEESPTPLGTFWITDPLDFSANPTGVYGAYALGLNGYSEVLEEFNGGPPQVAIHGTNDESVLGKAVSNGCIRLANEDVLAVAELAPIGTPVIVHASRDV